jgi:hypothetical protein
MANVAERCRRRHHDGRARVSHQCVGPRHRPRRRSRSGLGHHTHPSPRSAKRLTYLGAGLTISLMAKETVICTYRVRNEAEDRFRQLLQRHWRTLHDLGFVTDDEPLVFRTTEDGLTYVEIFTWVEGGFDQAHEHPDVLAIWEPMEPLLEDRGGLPRWEFPHYQRVTLAV